MSHRLFHLCLALGLSATVPMPASAAVRLCSETLVSAPGHGTSESKAKKAALDDWRLKAKAAGYPHSQWNTAAKKSLTCKKSSGKQFECSAIGQACVLKHAVPPGSVPAPPGPVAPVPAPAVTTPPMVPSPVPATKPEIRPDPIEVPTLKPSTTDGL
jgi:hypothetical protein